MKKLERLERDISMYNNTLRDCNRTIDGQGKRVKVLEESLRAEEQLRFTRDEELKEMVNKEKALEDEIATRKNLCDKLNDKYISLVISAGDKQKALMELLESGRYIIHNHKVCSCDDYTRKDKCLRCQWLSDYKALQGEK